MLNRNVVSAAAALALAVSAIAACQESSSPLPSPVERGALRESPDGLFCGGIAGFTCPEGLACIDDPSDDCHPERGGGADCGGICVEAEPHCERPGRLHYYVARDPEVCAATTFTCPSNLQPFFDDCGCGCEGGFQDGEPCGDSRCLAGHFCCNPSCGICAPIGGACIQTVCD